MSIKLLAVGNVLMEDDGVAIYLAAYLENELSALNIDVIYGETDINYSMSRIEDGDIIVILDAARLGGEAGEVTLLSMQDQGRDGDTLCWHDISARELIILFYPNCICYSIAIEVYEVDYHYGLSCILADKLPVIAQKVMEEIKSVALANIK